MNFSVIIPVYNSAATLRELISRLDAVPRADSQRYEVILVNDGSRDNSWQVIRQLSQEYSWLRGIDLMRNYGQHNALLAGIRAAQYETVVTMDDDLQHPPDEIPHLLQKLEEGYDVVYGTPKARQHNFWRNISSGLTRFVFSRALGGNIASIVSPFRAFRTILREAFANYSSSFVSIDVLLTWGTTRFGSIPVRHNPRRVGRSNYNFLALLVLALDMTTAFSAWPLRLASLIGLSVTFVGFVLLLYVIVAFLITHANISLFRFLAAIMAIFSGAQLFALGIIGEYLARMHFRMMARPVYAIRERTEGSLDHEVAENVQSAI